MSHAERCPVCQGVGKLPIGWPYATVNYGMQACHGCGGDGWVTVQDFSQFPFRRCIPQKQEAERCQGDAHDAARR